ncbi:MAG: RND family transporter, partial [Lachnospiraceae bacterium]
MEHFFDRIIRYRKVILIAFLALFILCALCQHMVSVNYDMNSYLPEDSPSTISLDVMEEEFDGGIPNARVMVRDVSLSEALDYKEKLENIDGVSSVTWLDDAINIHQPLETQDKDTIENYYKDDTALFTISIDKKKNLSAVADIRDLIGDENAMTGSAVSTAIATNSTVSEIQKIAIFAVIFVFIVLIFATTSWLEPFIILIGLGVAIVINAGTNLIFGEISFVTNAAGNILQLAVSLDYSIFLIHRFEECRHGKNPEAAMNEALCKSASSILSSGLTTVIGFLALVLMRFGIGPDLGLALAKGIAISLITVFIFMPGLILSTHRWMDKTKHRSLLPDFTGFGRLVSRITIPMTVLFALVIVPSYLSSTHNDYYYGSSHIFGEGTQLGDDTAAIEDIFGKSDTYVLLVPKGDTATETALSQELQELPQVTSILSFVDAAGAEIPYEYLDESTLELLESEHYSRMVISVDAAYEGSDTFSLIEDIRDTAKKYYSDEYYLAGEGVSTYDLMDTVTADMIKVNLVAIGAVFLVLLLTLKSVSLPIILVLVIETAIWINLSFSYYLGKPLFYIAYLIISSVQLGATVDYAILFTDRYKENRETLDKKNSIITTVSNVTASI